MWNKPIDKLSEDDLNLLIRDSVLESVEIEYKSEIKINQPSEKIEFLKDVTSFSNKKGGYLFYGIGSKKGCATDLCGIDVGDIDDLKLRLESIIREGVQPKIFPNIAGVLLKSGKYILILKIAKSYNRPHRVKDSSKYHSRNSAGTYIMDHDELKREMIFGSTIRQELDIFVNDRLLKITEGEAPVLLEHKPKLVLHCIPIDLFFEENSSYFSKFSKPMLSRTELKTRINFDGYVEYMRSDEEEGKCKEYLHLFRNVTFEYVTSEIMTEDNKFLEPYVYEDKVKEILKTMLDIFKKININPPFYICLTLLGAKGFKINPNIGTNQYNESYNIDNKTLKIPGNIIEGEELDEVINTMFERIWNACGRDRNLG